MRDQISKQRSKDVWLTPDHGDFERFVAQTAQITRAEDWPFASDIQSNIPIYQGDMVRAEAAAPHALMAEWATCLASGPGVIVVKAAMEDLGVVDRATRLFDQIIQSEAEAGTAVSDHFAKPGANDRVWNALQKHCLADPANFARYYANDTLALVSRAWLGAGYQVTAQVNRVNPGGAAQKAHRDYHLGFMSPQQMMAYPSHVHGVSPMLTLQGAIAHCDMPVESGPTMVLPFSQKFFEGYLAFGRPEFQAHFAKHHAQLPLEKGDMVFFNPALMHGAGHNVTTDIQRMANLLQIGSAFGRTMEAVDRGAMSVALYPELLREKDRLGARGVENAIAACAEGYPFPTSMDTDPPVAGLAPATQATKMAEALEAGLSAQDWNQFVEGWEAARTA